MSLLPTRLALAVAAALISLLGVAATASADLRIPTLGEATTLSTLPESVSWGSASTARRAGRTTYRKPLVVTTKRLAKLRCGSADLWGNAEAARKAPRPRR